MKITFVLPQNLLNGGIRVIGILATQLVARGHDVRLFTQPQRRYSARQRFGALLRGRNLPTPSTDGPFLDPILDRVTRLKTRRPVIDADLPDADVVIATWWETAAWVRDLSASKGAKAYFMQDYGAPGQELEKIAPTWEMPFTFITLNSGMRDMIRERNPGADVTIMRNAADRSLFDSPPRPRGMPPRVGLMYRSQPSKGMDVAHKALERMRKDIPNLRAIAVASRQAELPDWVEQVHKPDDRHLAEVYRSCDMWLFPSWLEGFGLPIIEAMASRTPVVSTRVGGAPDVIDDGVTGHLVDTGDWESMAARAVALLSGPEAHWGAMAAAAQASVTTYGWPDAVDVFEAALQRACMATSVDM